MADLILPGTIPGLLRRGSPVIAPVSKRVRVPGRRALVEGEHLDTGLVLLADGALEDASDLRLDLTDATGRAHAAWWLALREVPAEYHLDPAAVSWSRAPAQEAYGWALHWLARGVSGCGSLTGSWWSGSHGSPVPPSLLSDLNADDDRLLPNGSRWVDAEALRRVVLHVAGVSP